jgi:hypothetical protein
MSYGMTGFSFVKMLEGCFLFLTQALTVERKEFASNHKATARERRSGAPQGAGLRQHVSPIK